MKVFMLLVSLGLYTVLHSQSIGIIGTATPLGNWTTDIDMTQHSGNPDLWTIVISLSNGEVKFRQDDAWTYSWGGTTFHSGTGVPAGLNIPVTAGDYLVSFNTRSLLYNFDPISVGNVGIGTITPTEKLDVDGNIKFSGELKPNGVEGSDGQLLQSRGDGTMQWADRQSMQGSVGYGTWGDCEMANLTEYNPVDHPESNNSNFGYSVSISGDYAIVGAIYDNGPSANGQGSASILHYNTVTGKWEIEGDRLYDPDGQNDDHFGWSVSISGDYAIVGAPRDDGTAGSNQGSACIYERNDSTNIWELQGAKILNSSAAAGDYFGTSVSLSGDYAIVGAPEDTEGFGDRQGSVSFYKRDNGTGNWLLQGSKIVDSDPGLVDFFGHSVSISGDYAIIGAPFDDDIGGTNQGSASIYMLSPWSFQWELYGSKIFNISPATNDVFGWSVSISGDFAIVGASGDDISQGSAVVFKRNETAATWEVHSHKLLNLQAAANQQFGKSVAISGDYAIVGAHNETGMAGTKQGSASIFINIGSGWQLYQKITDPGGNSYDYFGNSLALDENTSRFVIGAYRALSTNGKVVFGKY